MKHTKVMTTYSGGVKNGPESKEFKEVIEQEEISKAKLKEKDGLRIPYLGNAKEKPKVVIVNKRKKN